MLTSVFEPAHGEPIDMATDVPVDFGSFTITIPDGAKVDASSEYEHFSAPDHLDRRGPAHLCRFAGVFPLRQPDQNTRVAKMLLNLQEICGDDRDQPL